MLMLSLNNWILLADVLSLATTFSVLCLLVVRCWVTSPQSCSFSQEEAFPDLKYNIIHHAQEKKNIYVRHLSDIVPMSDKSSVRCTRGWCREL